MDNDSMVLEDARDAAFAIDKAYRRAYNEDRLDDMVALQPKVEEAYDNYSLARLNLLKEGVIATDADVAEMRRIRGEVEQAASDQKLIEGAVRFIGFLARFA